MTAAAAPRAEERVVGIVARRPEVYSETFVRAHTERLPARTPLLHGTALRRMRAGDHRVLSPWERIAAECAQSVLRRPAASIEGRALRRFLRREGVDAVLAEHGTMGAMVADACAQARVPLVVHFHGIDAHSRRWLEAHREPYRRMFALAKAIIAVSRKMERHLAELGVPREKLFYNPCGADVSLFAGARPGDAPPRFVAVGRFVPKKGPDLTLQAFGELLKTRPDSSLAMIGEGPLYQRCRDMAASLGIDHAVTFLGKVPHPTVAETMRGARAFVHHAVEAPDGDSEGTPVSILEAGASGLAVVSTRHGGIPDVVVEGETGFLVDEGDVGGMAERMRRLVDAPELAKSMGRQARALVSERFSLDLSIAALWSIIERAIAEQRREPPSGAADR